MFSLASKLTRASESVGLYLGRQFVSVVHIVCNNRSCEIIRTDEIPCRLYQENETLRERELEAALVKMKSVINKNGLPVRVALPSALGSSFIKSVKAVPRNNSLRLALVRMEVESDRVAIQPLEIQYQLLGPQRGSHLLYGAALPISIVKTLQQLIQKTGLVLDKLNFDHIYYFNYVRGRFYADNESAAVIMLNADGWSLIVWDKLGRLRLTRSGWRLDSANSAAESVFRDLVTEIERHIRAYVHHDEPDGIDRVMVSVENPADLMFIDLLEGRMNDVPVRIDLRESTPLYKNCSEATSLVAMAAAFES